MGVCLTLTPGNVVTSSVMEYAYENISHSISGGLFRVADWPL